MLAGETTHTHTHTHAHRQIGVLHAQRYTFTVRQYRTRLRKSVMSVLDDPNAPDAALKLFPSKRMAMDGVAMNSVRRLRATLRLDSTVATTLPAVKSTRVISAMTIPDRSREARRADWSSVALDGVPATTVKSASMRIRNRDATRPRDR